MSDTTHAADTPARYADAVVVAPPRTATWLDDTLNRVGLRSAFSRDSALALIVTIVNLALVWALLEFLAEAGTLRFSPVHTASIVIVSAAQSLVLCIRRVRPALCLALIAATQIGLVALFPPGVGIRGMAPFIVAYTVAAVLPLRVAARSIALIGILEALGEIAASLFIAAPIFGSQPSILDALLGQDTGATGPMQAVGVAASTLLSYAFAALIGIFVAIHRANVELVRTRATDAIRDQQARFDAAISAERSRMARELHDIAAHHLSGMVVQAGAVERLIDKDPRAAKEATAWIRAQGKETLSNLRLVVGVLRDPTATPSAGLGDESAPVPGLDVVDELLTTTRDLGTPVEFSRRGTPYALAPIADVTVYRVIQEALSNARQHAAGAPVRVSLSYDVASVTLGVENDEAAQQPRTDGRRGLGLIGMRERAQLMGGEFDAGATPSGGWRVTLTVPTDQTTHRMLIEGGSA